MAKLFPSKWSSELVVNNVKHERELRIIEGHGIAIHRLPKILSEMDSTKNVLKSASGSDFYDLIGLGRQQSHVHD